MSENRGLKAWFKERFPLATFAYEVPAHANTFLFSLGGITLLSVVILVVTGIILAQYYTPNPETANQSIRIIMTDVKLGSLMRSIHVWAAETAVVSVILHLLRVLFYGSYKKPREVNWIFGVVLFALMIGLFFTGTVIKWDQEGYEALAHTVAIGKMFGGPFAAYLAPNDASLLSKFFSLHISVLPLLLAVVIVLHLFLIKVLKISPLPWKPRTIPAGKHTFTQHFVKLTGYFFILLGVLIGLAILLPASLGPLPVAGVESARPPWVFMGIFSIENWAGIPGLVYSSALVMLLLLLAPFLDRARSNLLRERKSIVAVAAALVLVLSGLTVNAYATKPEQHIGMSGEAAESAPVDNSTPMDNQKNMDTQEKTDTQSIGSVPQGIDKALNIITQLKDALTTKDANTALTQVKELDEAIDPVKDAIKAEDASLIPSLSAEAIEGAVQDSNFDKAGTLVAAMQDALAKAKVIFTSKESVAKGLATATDLLTQTKVAVANKDLTTAKAKLSDLDKTIDPLKSSISAKNGDLKKDLSVEAIEGVLKDDKPDWTKADALLDAFQQAVEAAKSLFE